MLLLSYNVRGLGGYDKRNEVRRLITDKHPYVLCIQETKMNVMAAGVVSYLWGSATYGFSFQPSVGASGGLLTVWDTNFVEATSTSSFNHVLVVRGRIIHTGQEFAIANVYAPCDTAAKQILWGQLSNFVLNNGDAPLCICGDFNSIRSREERKSRGVVFRQHDADIFNQFIEENFLVDLPICGRLFTWYRGDGHSMSRLDRYLLSVNWCSMWPNCIQVALQRGLSDHVPLVLRMDEANWGPRPIRMLKCWSDFPGYDQFVREKWGSLDVQGWGGFVLQQKLKMMKLSLKEWHQQHSKNMEGKIKETKERMATLDFKGETSELDEVEEAELHELSENLHSLARIHTSMCWQKSRLLWLREGDANTKFFHAVMSSRRRRNAIQTIQVNGVQTDGVEGIREAVFNHFSSHFKKVQVERPRIDNLNFRKLSLVESRDLTRPFTVEEVKNAIWDCDNYKSPGPDGVNFGFIKQFWLDLKDDFMRFITEFHRNGKLAKGINSTFIALIPKVDSPQLLNDFRPISLVGCMYKVLAKVLANRLRTVVSSVVSDTQSAFLKGKQILDGILVANEAVDEARRMNKEMLLFKVDFEKAFDSVDLHYLDSVMVNMNFPTLWRKWISECVGSATASVLVNGSPTEEFVIERGLRQGDPLSPFLFLLAAEGLNVLMQSMVSEGLYRGYTVGSTEGVEVSNLQFADDTLLLAEKSWANVRSMRAVLIIFEQISGLKVNFHKSMLTGVNVPISWLTEASLVMNCRVGTLPFVYLGLPVGGDARRLEFWKPVVDRIVNRLSNWSCKFLSLGGRLILLKSVLSSLPVYFLSFFKAPTGIISSLESLFKRFFWGGCEESRKISWVDWNSVCLPKEEGGLGVRRLCEFNLSLLGKWCWRMLGEKDRLWYRVLRARYGEEGGRLKEGGRESSLWWRMICGIRNGVGLGVGRWFDDNIRRVVGGGGDTYFWTDNWVGGVPLRIRFPRLFELVVNKWATVEDMERRGWEVGGDAWVWRRRLHAWEEESVSDCSILLHDVVLQANVHDRWRWMIDPAHGYSVKGTYQFLTMTDVPPERGSAVEVWHKQAPLKVSLFAWRLFRNRLPTKDNLLLRHVLHSDNIACVGGCGSSETAEHLFIGCAFFGRVWTLVLQWLGLSFVAPVGCRDHYLQFGHMAGLPLYSHSFSQIVWLACVWTIWKERNNRIFNQNPISVITIADQVKLLSFKWLKAKLHLFAFSYHDWLQHPLSCTGILL